MCNGCCHHQIKQILLDTFIEVLVDELNKLEHKNNYKIKDTNKIGNNLPESRRYTSKTNQKSSKHVDEEISDQFIWNGHVLSYGMVNDCHEKFSHNFSI